MQNKIESISKFNNDHLRLAINQAAAMKNCWAMIETYLTMAQTNLDICNSFGEAFKNFMKAGKS